SVRMAMRPFLLPAAVSGRHRPGRKTPCGASVMSHALAARTGCRARNPVRLEYTIGAAPCISSYRRDHDAEPAARAARPALRCDFPARSPAVAVAGQVLGHGLARRVGDLRPAGIRPAWRGAAPPAAPRRFMWSPLAL